MSVAGLHRKDPRRAIWNEVECGGYEADLALWDELVGELGEDEAVLELGCGAGRVVHHLASRFPQPVLGLDRDPNLVEAVRDRCHGIGGDAECEDVREFNLPGTEWSLILAPMQLIQLLGNSRERLACLACVQEHLRPAGKAAFAIVEELPPAPASPAPPLPDVREVDGWIYSSLPLEPIVEGALIRLRRLRQTVDPDGAMSEELNEVDLQAISAGELEEEADEVGLLPLERREIPATEAHVGSTVVMLEAAR